MSLNINDAADAYLTGSDAWETFITEFTSSWFMPLTLALVGAAFQAMDPGMLEQLRAANPIAFEKTIALLSGSGSKIKKGEEEDASNIL